MKLIKKRYKKIWFDDYLWDLVKLFEPDSRNPFILVKRDSGTVNENGTPAIEMALIDAANQEFYPADSIVNKIITSKKGYEQNIRKDEKRLSKIWLELYK